MPRRKLSTHDVARILRYHAKGYGIAELADAYAVHVNTVSRIVHRVTHKRVKPEAADLPPLLSPAARIAKNKRARDMVGQISRQTARR